jgi:hypothetical protein
MDPILKFQDELNRRTFLKLTGGVGITALFSLLGGEAFAAQGPNHRIGGLTGVPHFKPKANRVIYLHQSGAPSQLDLFDYKPGLADKRSENLPDSIRNGQRLTGMTSGQKTFPVAPSIFKFKQHGSNGIWLSELLPHLGEIADELCFVYSMQTEAINHDPAITFFQTG